MTEPTASTPDLPPPPPGEPAAAAADEVFVFPASFAQRRLWFIDRLEPGSSLYNIPLALHLTGALDRRALRAALGEIVRRHEALRTTFELEGDEPVQVVSPAGHFRLPRVDLEALPHPERADEARRLAAAEAALAFDLARGPLVRAALLALGGAVPEHVLLLTLHHIVADGWSLGVLGRELAALYGAFRAGRPSPLPEPPIQYADFAAWQRERLAAGLRERQMAWWRAQLDGAPRLLELPMARPRPAVRSHRARGAERTLPPEGVRRLCRREGVTPFMALFAAFQALLFRTTGRRDLVVGTPAANRGSEETEGLIGLFVNTLPLRTRLDGGTSFRTLLRQVRETALAAFAHQELPFEELVEELAPERGLSHAPLVQAVFGVGEGDGAAAGGGWRSGLPGLAVEPLPAEHETVKFDLALAIEETAAGLVARLHGSADLYEAAALERLLGHFATLLAAAVDDPERAVGDLPLLSPEEREQVLVHWNRTTCPYPRESTVHELVAEQARLRPEAVAVVAGEEVLTYAELDRRANRLARRLRALGLEVDAPVGVCLERSAGLIVALLAGLKAGGSYLPLDPSFPRERLAGMLSDGAVAVIVTEERLLPALPATAARVLCLDREAASLAAESAEPLPAAGLPESLAYVLYTSGSTGRPKGVAVPHRAVARLVRGNDFARLAAEDVFLQLAPVAFDASTLEIWGALANGARLVVHPPGVPSLEELGAFIQRHGVSVLWLTAGLFHQMVDEQLPALRGVAQLLAGGDVLSPAHVERVLAEGGDAVLVNGYGPTENTTFTCCHRLRAGSPIGDSVPIGRPIANTRVYLLDANLEPVPPGVPGELFTGGDGLARGYLAAPDLTAERFVPNPFGEPGERLYRTGDLARWLPSGAIEFLGRLDTQIKVRGYRIELGEIEAALAACPGLRETAVLARDGDSGEKRLVAYVVPEEGDGPPSVPELRRRLRERLPEFMVPSAFVVLPSLPLTPNGKVDRRALPAPEEAADHDGAAPLSPAEELVAAIWAEVLGLEGHGFSPEDVFFDLGGHSLRATQVASRLRAVFGVEVPLRRLFELTTLRGLAAHVAAARLAENAPAELPPIRPLPRVGPPPASFAQERLWFLDRLEGGGTAYTVPAAVRLRGPLDPAALHAALRGVVARHEALRTTFAPDAAGGPGVVQVVAPTLEVPLPLADLAAEGGEPEAELRRLAAEEAARPFDLERGPLLRAALVRLGPEHHVLLLTLHHIVADGWSMGVLLHELAALYRAAAAGEPDPLPPLAVQYGDFAVWQRRWLAGEALERLLAHWHAALSGAPQVLELPADRPRPAAQTFRGGRERLLLPPEAAAALAALARRQGTTLFMVLLAGVEALLHRLTGRDDLLVGSPIANRNRAEIEGLVGFFVNTLVLRGRPHGDAPFRALLAQAREVTLDAYAHQDLPFEKLVEHLQPRRELSRSPLFQVLVLLQNAPLAPPELPALELEPFESDAETAKFDLTLAFVEGRGGLAVAAEYARDLFDGPTVARWLGHLGRLLAAAAADPDLALGDLPLLSAAERQAVLSDWSDGGALVKASGGEGLLHALVAAQARRTPERTALVWAPEDGERMEWTYAELYGRAERLARRLAALGVGPEVRVGVALERTTDLPVALLGILAAGGAYVPLDPAYPPARLALMIDDARTGQDGFVILTQTALLPRLDELAAPGVELLCVDRLASDIPDAPPLSTRPLPGNLAYLIYTSGSTGRPKGVAIEHRSAAAFVRWARGRFSDAELAGVFASTSINFDLSVYELFVPLAGGGKVILGDNALALASTPAAGEVTLVNTVPSAMAELLRLGAVPPSVRTVNLAGEPLRNVLAQRIYALGTVERVWNLYGPSEDTTYSTFALAAPGAASEPTIGRAVAGSRAYVLDRRLEPCPAGVPGELYLGGAGLARGYLHRPELTAERFVPDPFAGEPGARLYRTGDLARWLAAGELEFLGRIDHQVKVRGFRIELGEIEAALAAHPDVREVVVLAREEDSGEKRLVAYVVAAEAERASEPSFARDLRADLATRLPDYMVPAAFVFLPALPLTPNGKVDRKALPAPEWTPAEKATAPRTPAEELLAAIWSEVLRRHDVGPDDDFFALGGHSLLATQVASRVREVFGVELPLRRVFERPTLAALAAEIETLRPEQAAAAAPRRRTLRPSFAQERLWFLDRLQPDSAVYNVPVALRLRGRLDLPRLAASLDAIARRHETLRTTFAFGDEGLVQVISPPAPRPLPLVDLSALGPAAREAEAGRLRAAAASLPFDLAAGPLLRSAVLRLAPEEHLALFTQHHIVTDDWSLGVLLHELTAFYAGMGAELPELPMQYADYADWQRSWLTGVALETQLAYWRRHLDGAPAVLELPTDRPRPPRQGFRGGSRTLLLPAEPSAAVRDLARREGATLFMTLLAAFSALLGRLSGQDDLVVGTPIANRTRVELEGLIGFFVNTLALRARLGGDPSFRELIAQVRETALGAYAHQDLPFEKLVDELQPERDRSRSPIFQVLFQVLNTPREPVALPGLDLEPLAERAETVKFDFVLSVKDGAPELRGVWYYRRDLFDAATVARIDERFRTLLAGAVAHPELRLSELPLLSPAERQHLFEWNATERPYAPDVCLHELIARQAERTPDAVAVSFGGAELTYRELQARARCLARRLRAEGVGPEVRVGICAERSLDLVVALVAILEAGGAYVPLDPSYPRERLAYLLADSRPAALLTQERLLGALPVDPGRVLLLDGLDEDQGTDGGPDGWVPPAVGPDNLAYVIYTSGSTGKPKGAMNSHRGIVNRLLWMQERYGLGPDDRVLQKTPFSFDVSVWEFFWPLLTGARLVVARPGGHQDPAYLVETVVAEGITTLHFVPSMLQVFLDAPAVERCRSLVHLLASGEALPPELEQRFFARLGATGAGLHNLYGPTEAAVDVTHWDCSPGGGRWTVPIGHPVANTEIHLLGRRLEPVPIGVPGELFIGGVQVGRGYLGRPELTAERFVPDPVSGRAGARLYRTGDLARRRPDGAVEFLGRLDHQVKVRGVRIELGEIEAALAAHPGVAEAVVMARGAGGETRLAAYLVPAGGAPAPDAEELRRHAARTLPEAMVPAAFVFLPALPLSPNGKVDRKALPEPQAPGEPGRAIVPPRTALERLLADLFAEVLHVGTIGVEDDFFALGGNSIQGATLINRLQERLREIVHVVAIFDAPTVSRLASFLEAEYPQAVARLTGAAAAAAAAGARPVDAAALARFEALVERGPRRLGTVPHRPAKNPAAVFVLSPPRSGSTLLRVMLAGHPRLFAPPELELLSFATLDERRAAFSGRDAFWREGLVRAVMEARGLDSAAAARLLEEQERSGTTTQDFYGSLQRWLGERLLVDKTPAYSFHPSILARAEEQFAGARYIHLVRHPCGTMRSFEDGHLDQIFFPGHDFPRRELAELTWLASHRNILAFLARVPPERQLRLRFEDLLRDPRAAMERVAGFLGLSFEPAMLEPYAERGARMTDGLHRESRMLGDVKFHQHRGIDSGVADRWRERDDEASLGAITAALAADLGYGRARETSAAAIERTSWRPGTPLPLSFPQERLWFLDRMQPGLATYNIPAALRLDGPLDLTAFRRALDAMVRRHASLRTTFVEEAGRPAQVVAPEGGARAALPLVDLSAVRAQGNREAEALRLAAAAARRPFDLAAGPLLRTAMLRLGREEHVFLFAMHHIVSDGWSMGVFLRELAALYGAFRDGRPSPLPEPLIQYPDFAAWQRAWLAGENLERQLAHWRERLAGAPPAPEVPTDRPRPPVQGTRGGQVTGGFAAGTAEALAKLTREEGVTLFMALLAAADALLLRYSGQEDVLVGSPIANRTRAETEGLIGFLVNTLVLRCDLAGDPTVRALVRRVRETALAAYAHQDVPFEKLVEELQPARDLSRPPFFQVLFVLQNAPPARGGLPGLEVSPLEVPSTTSKFDFTLVVAETRQGLQAGLEYSRDLFDATTAERLLRHFTALVEAAAERPDARLSELQLLSPRERQQLLREWNDTDALFPRHLALHELFEAQAARAPEAPAVLSAGETLAYGALERRANRLANALRAGGALPGDLVAIHLERSAEMVVALLAVHKAGCAYVPLEGSWPAERIHYILESKRIGHLLTQGSRLPTVEALPALPDLRQVVCLDRDAARIAAMPDDRPSAGAAPQDLAYIIFTSGSTGRPKGVMVRHEPAVNLVHWVNRRFGVGPEDRVLFITNLSFDLSVYDVFGLLAAGGSVRIASAAEVRDPARLVEILRTEPITFWDSAPAALQQCAPYFSHQPSSPLRLVFNSGDWIPITLPDRVKAAFPGAEFISLGGATEATVWSNYHPVGEVDPAWRSIPYGRPIDNARYHVLDARLEPCPIGVAGDLYIGGPCLSDGYANDPVLTAQKYVPSPWGPEAGARLYKTGDRARYWADGNLEFLGRVDTQVKVRGFRIELGEIEAVLAAHERVEEAVVLAREDTPGDQRLVAYYIPAGEPVDPIELRQLLQAKLPDYMVPAAFVARASWPLSPTGKLDRKALPPPETARASRAAALLPPRTATEKAVAAIWRELLGLDEVGVDESFFDLGGHSLLMVRVHARLRDELAAPVSMVELFQYPTIGSLAAHLDDLGAAVGAAPAARHVPRPAAGLAPEAASAAVAVVGMAGRFPGARDLEEFWANLREGRESIRFFSDEELLAAGFDPAYLADPRLVRARGVLDDPDLFDAAFFGFTPREAQILDPQQRLFLECAWQALEDAGYGAEAAHGGRVGVFAGVSENTYVLALLGDPELLRAVGRQQISIANNHDYLPTRVSYKLNLRGPSINVQTACSTSLVAVHLACRSLLAGECDLVLAGGASVRLPQVTGYLYQEGGIASRDGHTRAFDARACGVVGGNGGGVVVLKRLADALADGDTIRAVVRGTASNNDGALKVGFTAPSVEGQAEAILAAQRAAGVDPETIRYVEAHGTATPVGDPIEVAALTRAFRAGTAGRGFCALGSVKTNIGHLDAAAGVAGLIKTVLALEHREIPPSLHFEAPNPALALDESPFFVAARRADWPAAEGVPRRAGVSSFGIGGTNAHAVLEEAPEPAPSGEARPAQLLVLSARTAAALERATERLAAHLERRGELSDRDLADVAFTLQTGRKAFRERRTLVCRSAEEARETLAGADPRRLWTRTAGAPSGVAFLFPGQGAQHPGMGADLYRHEPAYRAALDRCCDLFEPELGLDLRPLLHAPADDAPAAARLAETAVTQPALFAVEYALAALWRAWGIAPAAMLGHSIGEYVAACLAGVFTLEEAVRLVAARGRLMQSVEPGEMLGVPLPERELASFLGDVSLAAVNAPASCVVSGPAAAVAALDEELGRKGVEARRLRTSHAFHSAMMEPILPAFRKTVETVDLRPPRIPYLSNCTGGWVTAGEATDPDYWVRHLRGTVRFADGLAALLAEPGRALLEVGPGRTLTTLANQHPEKGAAELIVATLNRPKDGGSDLEAALGAAARLWLAGVELDWQGLHAPARRRRVPLPTYPFERKRFWIEGRRLELLAAGAGGGAPAAESSSAMESEPEPAAVADEPAAGFVPPRSPAEERVAEAWAELLGVPRVGAFDDFFDLGGSSLMAVQLGTRLRDAFGVQLPSNFLLETSTVADLAERLAAAAGAEAAAPRPTCLVRLQPGGARPPLFMVHQVGGNVYTFRQLGRELGREQPLYGFRSLGLEAGEEPLDSAEAMAEHYLALLREAQPRGPYRIGGASMGGVVAYEMAQRLAAAGERVALLALMDTPCLDQLPPRPGDHAEFVASVFPGTASPGELRALPDDEQIAVALGRARDAGGPTAGLDLEQARRLIAVLRANVDALFAYRPRPYLGPMLFFRATDRPAGDSRRVELPWIELAQGGIEIHLVPGSHESMHEPPHVGAMAGLLRARLAAT